MPTHENFLLRPNPLGDSADLVKRMIYASRPFPGYVPAPTSTKEGVWNYSNNTTMADPGAGKFRVDGTTFASTANLAIDVQTTNGSDFTNILKTLAAGDIVTIQDKGNSANWARYSISATPTNNTGWFQIPVTPVSGGGSAPNNNTDCIIAYTQTGGGGGGGGPPTGAAGGDLAGSYPSPTVVEENLVLGIAPYLRRQDIPGLQAGKASPTGAAGGDLTGTYPNPVIAPLAVGNSEISDVSFSKVTGAPTSYPPSGAAGGDLSGTYPNPAVIGENLVLGQRAFATRDIAPGIPSVISTPGGSAGGDLSGTYPNPTVIRENLQLANRVFAQREPRPGQWWVTPAGPTVGGAVAVGMILPWTTSTPPTGWLLCDGSAVSRTTYSALFTLIGTTYGVGDGSTTFNLPNLAGRFPTMPGGPINPGVIGTAGGSATRTLDVNSLPAHTHVMLGRSRTTAATGNAPAFELGDPTQGSADQSTQSTGSGAAFSIVPPYLVVNYIICYSAAASGSVQPGGAAGGDLTGTYPNPTVKVQMSITSDASGLRLVNDLASPGNSMLYGTSAAGVKGWYTQPSGGGGGAPSGPAGGDLTGSTYPNPIVAPNVISAAKLNPAPGAGDVGKVLSIAAGPTIAYINPTAGGAVFVPAGPAHAQGQVPDPGAIAHPANRYFLNDNAQFAPVLGFIIGKSIVPTDQAIAQPNQWLGLPTAQVITYTPDVNQEVLYIAFAQTHNYFVNAVNAMQLDVFDGTTHTAYSIGSVSITAANAFYTMLGNGTINLTAGLTYTFTLQYRTNAGEGAFIQRALVIYRSG